MDQLLDEKLIIGGRTGYETLRPQALTTIGDLIINIKQELTLEQLAKIVHLYSVYLNDATLPLTIQLFSGKLLVHMMEIIGRRQPQGAPPFQHPRVLAQRILNALITRFSSLKRQFVILLTKKELHHPVTDSLITVNVVKGNFKYR